jgi:hypothetical protein
MLFVPFSSSRRNRLLRFAGDRKVLSARLIIEITTECCVVMVTGIKTGNDGLQIQ